MTKQSMNDPKCVWVTHGPPNVGSQRIVSDGDNFVYEVSKSKDAMGVQIWSQCPITSRAGYDLPNGLITHLARATYAYADDTLQRELATASAALVIERTRFIQASKDDVALHDVCDGIELLIRAAVASYGDELIIEPTVSASERAKKLLVCLTQMLASVTTRVESTETVTVTKTVIEEPTFITGS